MLALCIADKTAMSTKMSSCAAALTDNDVMWFATNLAGQIMGIVQYNDEVGAFGDINLRYMAKSRRGFFKFLANLSLRNLPDQMYY